MNHGFKNIVFIIIAIIVCSIVCLVINTFRTHLMPISHIYLSELTQNKNTVSFKVNFYDSAILPYSYKIEKTTDSELRIKTYGKLVNSQIAKWQWNDGMIQCVIEPDVKSVALWDGNDSKKVWTKNDGLVYEK